MIKKEIRNKAEKSLLKKECLLDGAYIHRLVYTLVRMSPYKLSHGKAEDVVFHMMDWLGDLESLVELYKTPSGKIDKKEAKQTLVNFLFHVPNHLAAASKLMLDFPVTDVFGIHAVNCGGKKGAQCRSAYALIKQ